MSNIYVWHLLNDYTCSVNCKRNHSAGSFWRMKTKRNIYYTVERRRRKNTSLGKRGKLSIFFSPTIEKCSHRYNKQDDIFNPNNAGLFEAAWARSVHRGYRDLKVVVNRQKKLVQNFFQIFFFCLYLFFIHLRELFQ